MLPLYEAKMIHQFDHRWATYDGRLDTKGNPVARDVTHDEKRDPHFTALPRYWVPGGEVARTLPDVSDRRWLFGWRDIARSTDERTTIAAGFPFSGVGNKLPLIVAASGPSWMLQVALSSFAADYAARTKVASTSLNFFYVRQFPVHGPDAANSDCPWDPDLALRDWLRVRALELTYTAWDLAPFAEDLGDIDPTTGAVNPPYVWDDERRSWLRAELDAAFFHLYGIDRDDAAYILDTFPIVRRHDEEQHGEYRTKNRILAIYDAMAVAAGQSAGTTSVPVGEGSASTTRPYRTVLDPPPGHGPRHERSSLPRSTDWSAP